MARDRGFPLMIYAAVVSRETMEDGMIEYEYIYVDKKLGDVSCENEDHALEMAYKFRTTAYRLTWKHGNIIERKEILNVRSNLS
jgi:hypothetical protein